MVRIKEIFTSIQGEGPYIGYKQLFFRFCECNLHCKYCDTDFAAKNSKEYSKKELIEICNNNKDCHSLSLTGGEPLLNTEFMYDFLPDCPLPVYLETNGTLHKNLSQIIDYTDYIAADIKLPSCTGLNPLWTEHDKFFEISNKKILFAKAVFNSHITNEEIETMCKLCAKYSIELILQPVMTGNTPEPTPDIMTSVLDKCSKIYKKTRLIPQVHKFINVI